MLLALAAAVAGCSAFDVFRPAAPAASPGGAVAGEPAKPQAPKRIAFDHKLHLSRGLECSNCHEDTEKADKAPMPVVEFCMNCHEEIDPAKPKERTVAAFLDKAGGSPVWSNVTAQAPGIVFSHKTHAAKAVDCAQCHKGIAESTAVTKDLFVDMDACTACHTKSNAKNDCATCHKEAAQSVAEGKGQFWAPASHVETWLTGHGPASRVAGPRARADRCDECHGQTGFPDTGSCTTCHTQTRPADHDRLWERLHGQAVRRDPDAVNGRCGFCHDQQGFPGQSKCLGCHATQAPRDHSQSWRVNAGHGLAAAMDRERCEACHKTDSCVACHSSMEPRNHRGGWGAPRNRHCAGCHVPLSLDTSGGCGVCHKATPSHSAAPRMPQQPPHRPDMQCRQCHDHPPNLKHFDNGSNCLTCHR